MQQTKFEYSEAENFCHYHLNLQKWYNDYVETIPDLQTCLFQGNATKKR